MAVRRFEDLMVWQRAMALCVEVYEATAAGAFGRDFGLRDQIRRAAVSVTSNVAEGFERYSRPEFRQFLAVARGSAAEVRSQLYVARALGYLAPQQVERLQAQCVEISSMLAALRTSLGRKRPDA